MARKAVAAQLRRSMQAWRAHDGDEDDATAPSAESAPHAEGDEPAIAEDRESAATASADPAKVKRKIHRTASGPPPTTGRPAPGLSDPQAIATAGGTVAVGPPLPTADAGHAVLGALSQGDPDGLRGLGIGTLPFISNSTEWGLGQYAPGHGGNAENAPPPSPAPGQQQWFQVVKGGAGAVNWTQVPDLKGIGHTHPANPIDPFAPAREAWQGVPGNGSMKFADLIQNLANRTKLFPSSSDIHYTFENRVEQHIVHTPYQVDPQTGNVFNPTMMRTVVVQQGQPLRFVIQRSKIATKPIGTMNLYEAELVAQAGAATVWQGKVKCMANYSATPPDLA